MLLILVAIGLGISGTIYATRSMARGQRVVAVVVFILAVIWLLVKLVQSGILGRATNG